MEVCVDSLESALNAVQGGATRLELCSSLNEGGLTPSIGLVKIVKKQVDVPVFAMVRPRSGDFVYSTSEVEVMKADIEILKKFDVDGLVFGVLRRDGAVNVELLEELIGLALPLPVTFHRAFDFVPDPLEALNTIIKANCKRILTSGGHSTALEGAHVISQLIENANDRIIIMPGGGISPTNIEQLLTITKAQEFHGSASEKILVKVNNVRNISLGSKCNEDGRKVCNADIVRKLIEQAKCVWDVENICSFQQSEEPDKVAED